MSSTEENIDGGQFEMVLGTSCLKLGLSMGHFGSVRSQFSWKKDSHKNFGPKLSLIGSSESCP